MFKVLFILSFLVMMPMSSLSQNSLNDYKYIIVPAQFEFLKTKDQYQLNSLTKFLFNKYGYTAFLEDESLPQDLRDNDCLGLTAEVVKESSFLKIKLRIDLKNCKGIVVQSSQVGETRVKVYEKAYNLALRDAFTTFQNAAYSYQPNESIVSQPDKDEVATNSTKQEEIEKLKEEIKSLKEEQQATPNKPEEKILEPKDTATVSNSEEKNTITPKLYAQVIDHGYQLVDSTPKVVMILLNTGVKDVFSVKDSKAIVYKKDGVWMYSEDGSIFKGNPLDIKF